MRSEHEKKRPSFVSTGVARAIFALCQAVAGYSFDEGRIGIIVGDGGHGKTTCLREYAITRQAVYVVFDGSMGRRGVLCEIAHALGADDNGFSPRLGRSISRSLLRKNRLLLLDECSSFNPALLDTLRQVICSRGRAPLILSGNSNLLRTINRADAGFDQFTSRLVRVLDLDRLASEGDGDDGLYTAADIRDLYSYGGIKLTSDAVDLAKRIIRTPRSGRLRTLDTVIRALHTSPAIRDCGYIDSGHILAAIEELDLPVKNRLPIADLKRFQTDVNQATKVG